MNSIRIHTLYALADMVGKTVYLTSPGTGLNADLGPKKVIVKATDFKTGKLLVAPVEAPNESYYISYGFMQLAYSEG